MLQYLLSHPEYRFSPQETADLCEAFDMAVAALQEHEGNSLNGVDESIREALSRQIVQHRLQGERDPRRLADHALELVKRL